MDLKEILAISGKPGLYRLVSQAKSGLIVESLIDGKRFPAFSHEQISSLEEISIFTEDDDIPLKEVLKSIVEKHDGAQVLVGKPSNNDLKAFFEDVLPEYDKDRVYVSHIKKVIGWYNLLQANDLLTEVLKDQPEESSTEETDSKE
ncbi:MAG: DUF5606 domain-containing protein [Bacteroidales bacterium]|nr:DUF5606 domain-containing protein [Bacteroidales bacterium]